MAMAEFCYAAAAVIWDDPLLNDFQGMCAPNEMVRVLCEGDGVQCPGGYHYVDHEGKRIDFEETGTLVDKLID